MWGIDARDYFEDFFSGDLNGFVGQSVGFSKVKLFRLQHFGWGIHRPTTTKKNIMDGLKQEKGKRVRAFAAYNCWR